MVGRPAGALDLALVVGLACTLYSAATAAACAGEKPGPPGSARLRNESSWMP